MEARTRLNENAQRTLLVLARTSITHGLNHGTPLQPDDHYDFPLSEPGASFVTLTMNGELRGCIGSLQAHQPLFIDVCENAYAAAFRDSRFTPPDMRDLEHLHIEISVLTPLEEIRFDSEDHLLNQLEPFEDGLVLQDGHHRGTFLPLVWEKLPDKHSFLSQLKLKAGLAPNYWSDSLRCYRYHTVIFEE